MTTQPEIGHMATEERIRAIAYAIWEEEGRPHGHHEEHWRRARELVAAEAPLPDWLKPKEPSAPETGLKAA